MRILLDSTSILATAASGCNMTLRRAKIALHVGRIRTFRKHVIIFCAAKTAAAQCEATVAFTFSDLEHHADDVVDPNVGPIRLIDKGQEFVTELDNRLALLLACVE